MKKKGGEIRTSKKASHRKSFGLLQGRKNKNLCKHSKEEAKKLVQWLKKKHIKICAQS